MLNPGYIFEVIGSLSPLQLSIGIPLLLLASVVRGLTGFGFSAIIVTGLSFVIPPTQAVILALLLEIVASIHLLPKAWKHIDWHLLGALGCGILIGTPLGVSLLSWLDPDVMRLLISCTVLFFALLILKGFNYRGPRNLPVHSGLGFISGICNGTAALGGLPVVTFLLSTQAQVAATRATLIAAFFGTDVYALIFAHGHGLLDARVIAMAFGSLPILLAGVALGQRLFSLASPDFFKKIALTLLLCLSLLGILRVVPSFL